MKITGYTPIKNISTAKPRKDSASSSSFLDFLSGAEETAGVEDTPPVEGAAPPSMLDAMLSLQEVPEDELRRKKAVQQGRVTLDTLEQLRHGLLTGSLPQHVIANLRQQLLNQREYINDPRLIEIIDDIELRAAVELAKLEMAASGKGTLV